MRLTAVAVVLATACSGPPEEPDEPVVLLALGGEDYVTETLVAGDRLVHGVERDRGDRRDIVVTGHAGEDPVIAGDHDDVRALAAGDVIGCTEGRIERLDAAGAFVPFATACGEVVEIGARLAIVSDAAWMTPGRLVIRDGDGTERIAGDDVLPGVAAAGDELVALTATGALVAIDPADGARRTLAGDVFAFQLDGDGRLAWEGRDGVVRVRPSLDGADREVAQLYPPVDGPPYDVFRLSGGYVYAFDDLQSLLVVASADSGAELALPDHDALDAVHDDRFVLARGAGDGRWARDLWIPGEAPRPLFDDLPTGTNIQVTADGVIAATSNGLAEAPLWFAPWDGQGAVLVADGSPFATGLDAGRIAVLTERRQQAGAEDWSSARAQLGRLRVVDLATGEAVEIARDVRASPEPQWVLGGVVFDQVDEATGTSSRVLVRGP